MATTVDECTQIGDTKLNTLTNQISQEFDKLNDKSRIPLRKHITASDRLNVPAQIDKLRDMQPGWLDGEGSAPSHSGLDWLSGIFSRYYPKNATLPYVYPTPEGGVDME